jgi:2-aminoadipate transaminase
MTSATSTARFARRTARLRASTIREMLKITQQPDIISFGGGLPAPELFPREEMVACMRQVMDRYGPESMQYSVSEGIPEMRGWVAQRLAPRFGRHIDNREVLIVNGSQQGLDLIAKVLVDPGDHVVLESPSYLGAIQAFDAYEARYLTVETDEDGIIPESLERVLECADPFPKFLYLVPNFQNPTGRTLARNRRELVVRICERYDLPIVEDDPYGELRFEGKDLPSLSSLATNGTIVYSGTGSKVVAPGLRVAWLVSRNHDLLEKIVLAKQGADLHSGTLAQYLFYIYASSDAFDLHVRKIVETYRRRRDVMHDSLREFAPAQVAYNKPHGGMFLWACVGGIDTAELLQHCMAKRVAFVPGESFYPARDVHDGMRLNFSNQSEENIREGIRRLCGAIAALTMTRERNSNG